MGGEGGWGISATVLGCFRAFRYISGCGSSGVELRGVWGSMIGFRVWDVRLFKLRSVGFDRVKGSGLWNIFCWLQAASFHPKGTLINLENYSYGCC